MKDRIALWMVFLSMCGAGGSMLTAQPVSQAAVLPVEGVRVERQADRLSVRFLLRLDSVEVASNQALKLQPVLVSGDSCRVLQPVVVAGRRQRIMHQREERQGVLVMPSPHERPSALYADEVAYCDWMNGAELRLMQDLCGCGGHPLSQTQVGQYPVWVDVPVYEVQPSLAFVSPKAEGVKHRSAKGRAFLDFPVNQTVIYPHYRQNPSELQKIQHTVDLIRNDTNTHITQICIHGYASPEGSWTNNRRLAQGRALALKQYVGQLYQFPDSLFRVTSTPEDWEGLQAWVEQSSWPQKEAIRRILATVADEDARNAALQRLEGGKPYARLLQEVYPSLRHSDYEVHYTVRAFCLDEARRLVKTRPQLLSLQEMYRVASSYPVGSDDFHEVFDVAVRMFPHDEVANLNVALALIHRKDYPQALRYLEKAGQSPEAVHARGVWHLLTEDYGEAERLLLQAEQMGVPEAAANLHQLRVKVANNKKRLLIN